jgi:hypothetical protein
MLQQRKRKMWRLSDQAWYATQSFCVIRIMSETSAPRPSGPLPNLSSSTEDSIVDSLLSDDLFGITLGASSSLMRCISDINRFARKQGSDIDSLSTAITAQDILLRLERCRTDSVPITGHDSGFITTQEKFLSEVHQRAFVAAATIYFYQTFYEVPPTSLAQYVEVILRDLVIFSTSGGTNFTFWIAVIAAMEVFEEEDKVGFRQIFASTNGLGVQDRLRIEEFVEEVWRIREVRAAETGLDPGLIKVDWKKVMDDLGVDFLLV